MRTSDPTYLLKLQKKKKIPLIVDVMGLKVSISILTVVLLSSPSLAHVNHPLALACDKFCNYHIQVNRMVRQVEGNIR
jgi:hypothetical protein